MESSALTPDDYIKQIPEDRRSAVQKLRELCKNNLPKGFEEQMSYGMIGFVVPHSIYPDGYHCNTKLPLPFLSFASQKNSINFYHMGIYANPKLYDWFVSEYPKHCKSKLDIGKSCIRFKKIEEIPFRLLEELVKKMTVEEWISLYESQYKK